MIYFFFVTCWSVWVYKLAVECTTDVRDKQFAPFGSIGRLEQAVSSLCCEHRVLRPICRFLVVYDSWMQ